MAHITVTTPSRSFRLRSTALVLVLTPLAFVASIGTCLLGTRVRVAASLPRVPRTALLVAGVVAAGLLVGYFAPFDLLPWNAAPAAALDH